MLPDSSRCFPMLPQNNIFREFHLPKGNLAFLHSHSIPHPRRAAPRPQSRPPRRAPVAHLALRRPPPPSVPPGRRPPPARRRPSPLVVGRARSVRGALRRRSIPAPLFFLFTAEQGRRSQRKSDAAPASIPLVAGGAQLSPPRHAPVPHPGAAPRP